MKKLLTVFLISIAISASAQTKKDTLLPPLKFPPDSAKILSKNDLEKFIKFFRDNFSVTYYDGVKPQEVIQQLYTWFIKEYNTPPKK